MSATVIIATTGVPELRKAIESVLNQTYKDTKCYIICDGQEYAGKVKPIVDDYMGSGQIALCFLPLNVGANGFYGHRIYASFAHLINTKYALFLDHDNTFDKDHIQSCVDTIEKNNLDWCYTLRKIIDKDDNYLCTDDCESLGKWPTYHGVHLIDTSTYCIKTEILIKTAHVWHMGWGADRAFPSVMFQHFPKVECTGKYSVGYRVDGNPGSVNKEFFENGNAIMNKKYNGVFPWRK